MLLIDAGLVAGVTVEHAGRRHVVHEHAENLGLGLRDHPSASPARAQVIVQDLLRLGHTLLHLAHPDHRPPLLGHLLRLLPRLGILYHDDHVQLYMYIKFKFRGCGYNVPRSPCSPLKEDFFLFFAYCAQHAE